MWNLQRTGTLNNFCCFLDIYQTIFVKIVDIYNFSLMHARKHALYLFSVEEVNCVLFAMQQFSRKHVVSFIV